MVDASSIRSLLDDRPDLEPAIEAVLEPEEPWTFDDVDVDSGAFGELVSRGVVENTEDGYRVADEEAVRTALGESDDDTGSSLKLPTTSTPSLSLPAIDRIAIIGFTGSLLLVGLLRLTSIPRVLRGSTTVLSANDPYYYRYWVEKLLTAEEVTIGTVPSAVARGEPLLVATLRLFTGLLGGTPEATGVVMAWYPVVTAVLTGAMVYALTATVTDDRRVAIAAVALFALTPGHAFRTSLGFADHHAFDYLWLAATALATTVLVVETTRRDTPRPLRTLGAVLTLAAGIAGQTLAWEAGPLLVLPLGVYLAVDSLLAVYTNRSPARSAAPILLGVGLAAWITWTAHTDLGWHTTLVAAAPALLFVGGLGVVTVGELSHRIGLPAIVPAAVELVGAVAAFLVVPDRYPEQWERVVRNANTRLFRTDAIAETGGLFGQSLGWLLLFGFVFVLAVPFLVFLTRKASEDPPWTPLVVYAWYFVALAIVQIRFVGQMAPFVAVFAGVGFVHLAEWVDIVDQPPAPLTGELDEVRTLSVPDRATLRSLVLLFLLVGSLSFVQIPIKTSQLTHSDAQYETTMWMAEYADERAWEYPDNYVFSPWGDNRFYNYFVNGESRSYGFARSQYSTFLTSTDARQWYQRLRDRVGFVIVPSAAVGNATTIGTRLYATDGSDTGVASGLSHYRLVYVSEQESYKVFTLVPGATLNGTGPVNETITVRTSVTVGTYTTTYERAIETGPGGNYSVTVPYTGEYRVANNTVRVTESSVRNGTTVSVQ